MLSWLAVRCRPCTVVSRTPARACRAVPACISYGLSCYRSFRRTLPRSPCHSPTMMTDSCWRRRKHWRRRLKHHVTPQYHGCRVIAGTEARNGSGWWSEGLLCLYIEVSSQNHFRRPFKIFILSNAFLALTGYSLYWANELHVYYSLIQHQKDALSNELTPPWYRLLTYYASFWYFPSYLHHSFKIHSPSS